MHDKRFKAWPLKVKVLLSLFLFVFFVAGGYSEAQTNPSVSIFANKTAYTPNMDMKISIHTLPASDQRRVDLYVALRLPDGRILFFPDLESSISPLGGNVLLFDEISQIVRFRIPPVAQTGEYTWIAGLTVPGTFNIVGNILQITTTISADENMVALHDESTPEHNDDCMSCHRGVLERATLSPSIRSIHAVMVPLISGATDNQRCATCHRGLVVLDENKSPAHANLRRNVSVEICARCHGPSGPGSQFYLSN